jgi:aminomuconate-semialdehyde/2-hydroxymuconate-6-semialdehyde dehydrogenase
MKLHNYINGELIAPISGEYLDNYNPANGEVYSYIPRSGEQDVAKAVEAAQKAFPAWANSTLEFRSKILLRIADLINENLEDLAVAETKDNGKPLSLSTSVDIPRASSNFSFFAKAITQFASESHESVGTNTINFTLRKPIGVVGCISPWNLPLYLFSWKIAPALAAGNCVVAKPSEVTPYTAFLLSKICIEAGLPKGVLNIVHGLGNEVGQAIVAHPNIKAISFTGGTSTGKHIASVAAPMFKKLSLELGGKNASIVFEDVNYEEALSTVARAAFANQGQICLCGSRILVQKSIYHQFKKDLIDKIKDLKVGNPLEKNTNLGALVSKEHLHKVRSYIEKVDGKNAVILVGGKQLHPKGLENGYYLEPTLLEVTSNSCLWNQEEIFGPIATLMPFEDEKEAIALANDTTYGLSASIWTQNLDRCMRMSQHIETGIIWFNTWLNRDLRTPFGGMKASGVGREGGFEALRFFTEPKNVCIQYKANEK